MPDIGTRPHTGSPPRRAHRMHISGWCCGAHDHHRATGALGRVGGHGQEVSPPGVENGSVEPCFGFGPVRFVAPFSIWTRSGSPGHVLDLQVLKDNEVVVGDQLPGPLVGEVAALVPNLAVLGRHPLPGLLSTSGTLRLGGELALRGGQGSLAASGEPGVLDQPPVTGRQQDPTPRSIPTICPVEGSGSAGTSTQWTLTVNRLPSRRTVIVLGVPQLGRCRRTLTWPTPWSRSRPDSSLSAQPLRSSHCAESNWPRPLNRGNPGPGRPTASEEPWKSRLSHRRVPRATV